MSVLALLLVGIWLILSSQTPPSPTLTLLFGIAVVILVLLDFAPRRGARPWRGPE